MINAINHQQINHAYKLLKLVADTYHVIEDAITIIAAQVDGINNRSTPVEVKHSTLRNNYSQTFAIMWKIL